MRSQRGAAAASGRDGERALGAPAGASLRQPLIELGAARSVDLDLKPVPAARVGLSLLLPGHGEALAARPVGLEFLSLALVRGRAGVESPAPGVLAERAEATLPLLCPVLEELAAPKVSANEREREGTP